MHIIALRSTAVPFECMPSYYAATGVVKSMLKDVDIKQRRDDHGYACVSGVLFISLVVWFVRGSIHVRSRNPQAVTIDKGAKYKVLRLFVTQGPRRKCNTKIIEHNCSMPAQAVADQASSCLLYTSPSPRD